jgi:peptidyl-prolyl cis-trans isomerase SDCCAG10
MIMTKKPSKSKSKSSHDLLKDDPRLSQQVAVEIPSETKKRPLESIEGDEDDGEYDSAMRDKVRRKMEEKRKEMEKSKESQLKNGSEKKESSMYSITIPFFFPLFAHHCIAI